jgi:hypothetical protein
MWHAKTFATDQTRAEDSKARAIYEEELNRVWPNDGNQRERKIARFAEDNGFRLRFIVTVYARFSIESLASVPRKVIKLFLQRKLERRRHRRRSLCVGVPCPSANPFPGSAASSFVKDRLALRPPRMPSRWLQSRE